MLDLSNNEEIFFLSYIDYPFPLIINCLIFHFVVNASTIIFHPYNLRFVDSSFKEVIDVLYLIN